MPQHLWLYINVIIVFLLPRVSSINPTHIIWRNYDPSPAWRVRPFGDTMDFLQLGCPFHPLVNHWLIIIFQTELTILGDPYHDPHPFQGKQVGGSSSLSRSAWHGRSKGPTKYDSYGRCLTCHRPGKWSQTSGIRDELFLDKPYQISEEKDIYYSNVQHKAQLLCLSVSFFFEG